MSFDGLIWEPQNREGFLADPVSMAEILWSIQEDWYVLSIYDPEDQEKFSAAMEYYVDVGLFEKAFTPNVEVIFKLKVNHRCISDLVLVKPNDLRALVCMIAYSDFDGLQIRSLDKNKRGNNFLNLWCDSEKIFFNDTADWLERLPSIKHQSTINLIWGLPNWDYYGTALVISENEQALYHMKNIILQYQQIHKKNNDKEYVHKAILCDAMEEIFKWPKS